MFLDCCFLFFRVVVVLLKGAVFACECECECEGVQFTVQLFELCALCSYAAEKSEQEQGVSIGIQKKATKAKERMGQMEVEVRSMKL